MFTGTLSDDAKTALALLGKSSLVKDAYLVGGSALALYYGHRYSHDLDFFTKEKFDPIKLSKTLGEIAPFAEELAKGISLIGTFNKVKFSYFQYDYPLIASIRTFMGINIAHPHDIAAMKISALMDRGTKRDFVDLYEIVKHGISIEIMFKYYDQKYGVFANNRYSIIKSLGYFDDAEGSEMPQMIKKVSWEQVKDFFAKESLRLGKKYL